MDLISISSHPDHVLGQTEGKQLVLKIISPLLTAAKAMWKLKEDSRREVLLGVPTAAEKIQLARQKKKHGDIRRWLKRVQHKVDHLQHVTEAHQDIDSTSTLDLLSEPPPPSPRARTRLRRTLTPQEILPPHPAPIVRWRTTTIQDFFSLTREHSKKMIAKNPPHWTNTVPQAHTNGTARHEH